MTRSETGARVVETTDVGVEPTPAGAPTADGIVATQGTAPLAGSDAPATFGDEPLASLDLDMRRRFAAIADRLIPAAHGMPSAAHVVRDDRLAFVLRARPDLIAPLRRALRPDLGEDPAERLAALEQEDPSIVAALQLTIVGGYYTDRRVRDLLGYPGQQALQVRSWEYPVYLEEGLIDQVLARGPVWRDPATGMRAVADVTTTTDADGSGPVPAAATPGTPQGGNHGRDGA